MSALKQIQDKQDRLNLIAMELEALEGKVGPLKAEQEEIKKTVDLAIAAVAEAREEIIKDFQEHYNALCITLVDNGDKRAGIADIRNFGESTNLDHDLLDDESSEDPPESAQAA